MQMSRLIALKSLIKRSLTPHTAHSTTVENIRQITPIMQNKPNLSDGKVSLTPYAISTCKISSACGSKKTNPIQTQSNPIRKRQKTDISLYRTSTYHKTAAFSRPKNKPNSNPAQKTVINTYTTALYTKKTAPRPPKNKAKQTQSVFQGLLSRVLAPYPETNSPKLQIVGQTLLSSTRIRTLSEITDGILQIRLYPTVLPLAIRFQLPSI
jgi:hypothetical protein